MTLRILLYEILINYGLSVAILLVGVLVGFAIGRRGRK